MNDDKTGLKMVLGILGALAVVAALWRVLAYEPGRAGQTPPAVKTAVAASQSPLEQAPRTEILDEFLESDSPVAFTKQSRPLTPVTVENNPLLAYPQNRAPRKQPYPGRASAVNGKRYVGTNFYTQDNKSPTAYTTQPNTAYTSGSYAAPQANFNTSTRDRMQQERAQMLAPYLRPNRKEKEQMDAKWAKLSAAIERAVAQALTPKSKREQNIEKYSASTKAVQTQASGFTGPYAPVGSAIAAQKQDIVKSFGSAFGGRAAAQASSLMDNYAQELAGALNMPNATPEQKEQKVKEISKKYQKEMNQLAEKNQYDKFVADRIAQDNKQKEELGSLYPDEKVQISELIDQTREKDLALATQNLPRDEYFNQLAQNNQQLRSGIEELVTKGGKSVQEFHQWEQAKNKDYLNTLGKLEEQGQIQSVARVATPDERRKTQAEIEAQSPKILDDITKSFGEEAKADFEPILKNYEQMLKQIDEEKLSIAQRETKKINAMNEANRQLINQKMHYVEKMDIPNEQKQALLEKLRQDYNNIK